MTRGSMCAMHHSLLRPNIITTATWFGIQVQSPSTQPLVTPLTPFQAQRSPLRCPSLRPLSSSSSFNVRENALMSIARDARVNAQGKSSCYYQSKGLNDSEFSRIYYRFRVRFFAPSHTQRRAIARRKHACHEQVQLKESNGVCHVT